MMACIGLISVTQNVHDFANAVADACNCTDVTFDSHANGVGSIEHFVKLLTHV